jgi:hypothetical protein
MKGNKIKKVLLLLGLVCLIPLILLGVSMSADLYRFFNPYLDRDIAGPVTISSEWLEIVPQRPLLVERQIQMIVLDLDKSIKLERDGWGLVLPDGSVVKPQVQVISDDGKTYDLNHPAFWWNPSTGVTYAEFSLLELLPKDRTYRQVRIRADKAVRCNRIFWRNYNQWDVS